MTVASSPDTPSLVLVAVRGACAREHERIPVKVMRIFVSKFVHVYALWRDRCACGRLDGWFSDDDC